MEIKGMKITGNYLESLPLSNVVKYSDGPPKNAVPFIGYPQQHPAEKDKLILVYDPLGYNPSGKSPAVLEFKLDDIVYVEDVPQAVTEKGEGIPLVKLWIRRGAHGMFLEPFEVDESLAFMEAHREFKERFMKQRPNSEGSSAGHL